MQKQQGDLQDWIYRAARYCAAADKGQTIVKFPGMPLDYRTITNISYQYYDKTCKKQQNQKKSCIIIELLMPGNAALIQNFNNIPGTSRLGTACHYASQIVIF